MARRACSSALVHPTDRLDSGEEGSHSAFESDAGFRTYAASDTCSLPLEEGGRGFDE